MKRAVTIFFVVAIQILLFVFIWDWLVDAAVKSGREQRGGVAFGITVYYSAFILGFVFLIATIVSAIARRRSTRWLVIGGFLVGWSLWIYPSLSNYPIRGTVYLSLGALILIAGSGILLPILNRTSMESGNKDSEQDASSNH